MAFHICLGVELGLAGSVAGHIVVRIAGLRFSLPLGFVTFLAHVAGIYSTVVETTWATARKKRNLKLDLA